MTNGLDVTEINPGGTEMIFYDFGGQPIYATSHQLFLRSRAVFCVAWDPRVESVSMDSYACDVLDANPEAPLLFVSTKSDDGHCPLTETQQEAMKEKYGDRFMGYFNVSAKANVNMTELLDSILSTAKSLPNMNETVPRSYHNLRNKIKVSAAERYLLTRRFAPLAPIARSIRA